MANGSANEILIRFKTVALERAKKLTEDIEKKIKNAGRQIKDVAVRNKFVGRASVLAEEKRQEIQQQDFAIRARRLAEQQQDFGRATRGGVSQGKEALEKGGKLLNAAADPLGALRVLGAAIPGLGQIAGAAALVGAVAKVVLPFLQKELDAKFKAAENAALLRQQRAFLAADVGRRFREDVDFRDEQTRRAVREFLDQERAARAGGWRRRGFTVPE